MVSLLSQSKNTVSRIELKAVGRQPNPGLVACHPAKKLQLPPTVSHCLRLTAQKAY